MKIEELPKEKFAEFVEKVYEKLLKHPKARKALADSHFISEYYIPDIDYSWHLVHDQFDFHDGKVSDCDKCDMYHTKMKYKDRESWVGVNSGTMNSMKALLLKKVRLEGKASTMLDLMPLQKVSKEALKQVKEELGYE